MVRHPLHRLTTAMLVVLSLLFSQLAFANYVCPVAAAPADAPRAMAMADIESCEGMAMMADGKAMDEDQPVLCHQHCVNAPQSADTVQVPALSLPAVVHAFVVPLLVDEGAAASVVFAEAARERPPPGPVFLSTLRLRV